jgi:hypothetical protein
VPYLSAAQVPAVRPEPVCTPHRGRERHDHHQGIRHNPARDQQQDA